MSGAQQVAHVAVDGGRAMEAAQHEAFERTQSVLDSLDARVMALTKAVKQAQAEREAVDNAIKGLLASDDVSGLDAVDKEDALAMAHSIGDRLALLRVYVMTKPPTEEQKAAFDKANLRLDTLAHAIYEDGAGESKENLLRLRHWVDGIHTVATHAATGFADGRFEADFLVCTQHQRDDLTRRAVEVEELVGLLEQHKPLPEEKRPRGPRPAGSFSVETGGAGATAAGVDGGAGHAAAPPQQPTPRPSRPPPRAHGERAGHSSPHPAPEPSWRETRGGPRARRQAPRPQAGDTSIPVHFGAPSPRPHTSATQPQMRRARRPSLDENHRPHFMPEEPHAFARHTPAARRFRDPDPYFQERDVRRRHAGDWMHGDLLREAEAMFRRRPYEDDGFW